MGLLFVVAFIQEGFDRRELIKGDPAHGTFTLETRIRKTYGKPPASYGWRGRFVSDDGSIDRAVWTDDLVDKAFLEDGSRAWRNWVEAAIFTAVFSSLFGAIAVAVAIRRRRSLTSGDLSLGDVPLRKA